MKRGILENIGASSEISIPDFLKIRKIVDKLEKFGKIISINDLDLEDRNFILKFKNIIKIYGVEINENGYLIIKQIAEEKIKKIRNFILKNPFIRYYVPDSNLENLMNLLIKNNFIDFVEMVNVYGNPVDLAKPGKIEMKKNSEINEIMSLIEAVSKQKYTLACRLIDLCSSVILNGSSSYELYFLDGNFFKCSEETFVKDVEGLNFEIVNPEEELKEIRFAALPVSNVNREYDEARDSYYMLVDYLKSILKEENSLVMKANNRLELALSHSEAIYMDEENGYVYFNKTVIERALTSTGRAIFDKNYAKSILRSFYKFCGDFGVEESVVANRTIYRIKRDKIL